jgi:hypothetical protein
MPLHAYHAADVTWAAVQPGDLTQHLLAALIAHTYLNHDNANTISARSLEFWLW